MLKPIEKQRVAEEIVEQLRSLILTGQYQVGSKLPPERELAKKLGVNRASLREALKKLEHLGLVRIRQGDGTRVQNFMETAGIELVRHLVPLGSSVDPDITRDVLEFRRVIGSEVARMAAERANDDDVEALTAIADRAANPAADEAEVFAADFEFYLAMTAATKNRVMVLLVNTVRDAVKSYIPFLAHLTVSPDAVRKHHRDLIEAIRNADSDRAAKVAQAYLQDGAHHILKLLEAGQLPTNVALDS